MNGYDTQPQFNNHSSQPQTASNFSYQGGQDPLDAQGYYGVDDMRQTISEVQNVKKARNSIDHDEIIFLGFNQIQTVISVGTQIGFKLYRTNPAQLFLSRELHGGIGRIELRYQESIMALVGGGKNPKWPNTKVIIWDDEEVKPIRELIFNAEVEGVKMRRESLIVLQKRSIYIYSYPEFEPIGQLEIFEAEKPIWGLSMSDKNFVLAFQARDEENLGSILVKKSLDFRINPQVLVAHTQSRV